MIPLIQRVGGRRVSDEAREAPRKMKAEYDESRGARRDRLAAQGVVLHSGAAMDSKTCCGCDYFLLGEWRHAKCYVCGGYGFVREGR